MTMKGDARKASYVLRDARCGGRAEALRGQTGLPRGHRPSPPPAALFVGGPTLAPALAPAFGAAQGVGPAAGGADPVPAAVPPAGPVPAAAAGPHSPCCGAGREQRPYRPVTAEFRQDWRDLPNEVKQLVLDVYYDQWRQEPEAENIAAYVRERQWTDAGFDRTMGSYFKLALLERCLRRARPTSGTATPRRTGPIAWSGASMGWTCASRESQPIFGRLEQWQDRGASRRQPPSRLAAAACRPGSATAHAAGGIGSPGGLGRHGGHHLSVWRARWPCVACPRRAWRAHACLDCRQPAGKKRRAPQPRAPRETGWVPRGQGRSAN